jgi:hypothetical protein
VPLRRHLEVLVPTHQRLELLGQSHALE